LEGSDVSGCMEEQVITNKYTEEYLKNLKKSCVANPLTDCVFDNVSMEKDASHLKRIVKEDP